MDDRLQVLLWEPGDGPVAYVDRIATPRRGKRRDRNVSPNRSHRAPSRALGGAGVGPTSAMDEVGGGAGSRSQSDTRVCDGGAAAGRMGDSARYRTGQDGRGDWPARSPVGLRWSLGVRSRRRLAP